MRKYAIVQEYKSVPISGINVVKDSTNFLCNNLMDIEDEIRIFSSNYPIYNYDDLKFQSINLKLDNKQSNNDLIGQTKWIIEFNSDKLLRQYLYNEIYLYNQNSVFKQIPQHIIPNNNLSDLVYNYIDQNLLNKYRVKEFILWTEPYQLKNNIIPGQNLQLLYQQPIFNKFITQFKEDKDKRLINIKKYLDNRYEINYTQEYSSKYFTFVYYYDVIYEKI